MRLHDDITMTTRTHTLAPYRIRRGVTAVLAMLFLVLIGVLALGFFASTTVSMQLAKNDQKGAKALFAAESGVQFMRYHLRHVTVTSSTDANQMMTDLYNDMCAVFNGTGNLGTNTVGFSNNTITIPAEAGKYIPLDGTENTGFSVTISNVGGGATSIVCKVIGSTGSGTTARDKGVQLTFTRAPNTTSIFDNAVAAKGKVVMSKGSLGGVSGISPDTIASVTSALNASNAMVMSGGAIGGNVGVLDTAFASITGGTIHGTSSVATMLANGYLSAVSNPEFPTIDTSVFLPYATSTYSSGSTLSNMVIPPNTNPKFTGNATINGIVYVKSPNTIEFRGNTTLAGFIVFENTGDTTVNKIDMKGNFSVANLPSGSQYDALRAISGVAIIGPTAALTMSGSADSNFRGNVIVGTFVNGGSADIQFDSGSLVAMEDTVTAVNFNGKTVKWKSTGSSNQPSTGLTYSSHFNPSGGTYLELN
jgi:Tfp pilus assembly protein PilX